MAKYVTIDDYISQLPEHVHEQAESLRFTILNSVKGLVETIRYDMPAFRYGDATVIYFAFWKKHIGLYPIYRGTVLFEAKLKPYRAKTDSVQLPLEMPIPLELVAEIVKSQMSRITS